MFSRRFGGVDLMFGMVREFILRTGYARWNHHTRSSETFLECLSRVIEMHVRRFPQLESEIRWAAERVQEGLVLPAMRSLQYGGAAIEHEPIRIYNTWGAHADRPEVFGEALLLLLSGGGIGFSVQRQHVGALPEVAPVQSELVFRVADSIRGWGDALTQLIVGRYQGVRVQLDLSGLRPSGSQDPISGDYVAGPESLRRLELRVHHLFDQAEGRKLFPIECYDLFCYAADAAVAEHNGRSAMLALFSPDDEDMLLAKTGNWYESHPWRARSNNSAVLIRGQANRSDFDRLFEFCHEWGEPGIYWTDNPDTCSNSCVESGFYPVLTLNREQAEILGRQEGERVSGWQGCTLSEINGAVLKDLNEFKVAARAAAILNTVQAAYTEIEDALGWVSRWLCERDALIGVGITGMADNPAVALNPEYQNQAALVVRQANAEIAEKLGIHVAKRATLVKPAGKTSLLFGGVSPGIHPRHAEKYFMRFVPKKYHPAYHHFKDLYPHLVLGMDHQERIVFAIEAPEGALVRDTLSAIDLLNLAKLTLLNWVYPGTLDADPPVRHNVSITVTVGDHEWTEVRDFLWEYQAIFSGVALMGYFGDMKHPLAPLQKLMDAEDYDVWKRLYRYGFTLGPDRTGESTPASGPVLWPPQVPKRAGEAADDRGQ